MRASCLLLGIYSILTNVDSILSDTTYQPCESPQFVQLGTKGIVHCNFSEDYFGIYWYNSTDYVNDFSLINIKGFEKDGPGFESGEYDIYPNGSLVLTSSNFEHAHKYTVVKLDSPTDEIIPHYVDVVVQALPIPSYPVIEGCNPPHACVMEVGHQGNLTCSVKGIVPSVDLEWRRVDEDTSITFIRNHQKTTRTKGGRFDVLLTSSFVLNDTRDYTSTVECRVIVYQKGPQFDLRSQVFLVFTEETNDQTTPTNGNKPVKGFPVAAVVVPVIIAVIIVTSAVVFVLKKCRRRIAEPYVEMTNVTTEPKKSQKELESLLELSDKVKLFKEYLRETYKDRFGNIEVISTIQDYDDDSKEIAKTTETVDTIDEGSMDDDEGSEGMNDSKFANDAEDKNSFTEQTDGKTAEEVDNKDVGKTAKKEFYWTKSEKEKVKGNAIETSNAVKMSDTSHTEAVACSENRFLIVPVVQVLASMPGSRTQGVWKNVKSISKVLTDASIDCNSFIVEGEFGYEISTISKLLAREWSMEEDSSLASCFDLLIILKMNQIRVDKNIYSEIKRLLMKPDHSLTDEDIEKVVSKHHKVAFILDGFNMYVDSECKRNCELTKIITREILKDCTVVLTSSSPCVPNYSKQEYTRLRAKALSESDQEFLIDKEVVLKNAGGGDQIRSVVKENIFLRDILQIPFFFESFLKMARHMTNIPKFQSVTLFFLRIISGLYVQSSQGGDNVALWDDKLGKFALEALTSNTSQKRKDMNWSKGKICENLGEDVYNFYHQMGVLKEENVPHLSLQSVQSPNTPFEVTVRFAHLLFCEWYASHHLLTMYNNHDEQFIKYSLKRLLLNEYWYCIRFLCGINEDIYLKVCEIIEPKVLQILCNLEATNSMESITDVVKSWCSKEVSLTEEDSRIQQMATVQLLEFGSKKEVPDLTLRNCFNSVEGFTEFLELRSGVQIPVLKTLKRLDLIEEGRELTNEEATGIINFALRCSKLVDVKFCQCILPKTLQGINKTDASKLRDVKVEWTPYTNSPHAYTLDRKSFTWKQHRGDKVDDVVYRGLVEEFRDKHGIRSTTRFETLNIPEEANED